MQSAGFFLEKNNRFDVNDTTWLNLFKKNAFFLTKNRSLDTPDDQVE
jgi:hypothetical protein